MLDSSDVIQYLYTHFGLKVELQALDLVQDLSAIFVLYLLRLWGHLSWSNLKVFQAYYRFQLGPSNVVEGAFASDSGYQRLPPG